MAETLAPITYQIPTIEGVSGEAVVRRVIADNFCYYQAIWHAIQRGHNVYKVDKRTKGNMSAFYGYVVAAAYSAEDGICVARQPKREHFPTKAAGPKDFAREYSHTPPF